MLVAEVQDLGRLERSTLHWVAKDEEVQVQNPEALVALVEAVADGLPAVCYAFGSLLAEAEEG